MLRAHWSFFIEFIINKNYMLNRIILATKHEFKTLFLNKASNKNLFCVFESIQICLAIHIVNFLINLII